MNRSRSTAPGGAGSDAAGPAPRHHILSVLVENKAGVLARVAGLFSRRGFNIFSLAVAPTDETSASAASPSWSTWSPRPWSR